MAEVSSTIASHACSVLALSALVTPFEILPPIVPMFLICGPPTMSTASPSTFICSFISGSLVMCEKLVSGSILSVPSSSMLMPLSASMPYMLTSSQPASLPSLSFISTSLPPAIIFASGCCRISSIASFTLFASYSAFMSYMPCVPPYQISPSSRKRSNNICGVRGAVSISTPVAFSTALRMAGAPLVAGGSPSAFVPYALVGS